MGHKLHSKTYSLQYLLTYLLFIFFPCWFKLLSDVFFFQLERLLVFLVRQVCWKWIISIFIYLFTVYLNSLKHNISLVSDVSFYLCMTLFISPSFLKGSFTLWTDFFFLFSPALWICHSSVFQPPLSLMRSQPLINCYSLVCHELLFFCCFQDSLSLFCFQWLDGDMSTCVSLCVYLIWVPWIFCI